MASKKRKMTKRQLLNALLENEEKKIKLEESQQRLWNRGNRIEEEREKLEKELKEVILNEQEKNGGSSYEIEGPIVYKGHAFTYTKRNAYAYDSAKGFKITPAKLV